MNLRGLFDRASEEYRDAKLSIAINGRSEGALKYIFSNVLRARWIVGVGDGNRGEMGLRIAGVNLWYYNDSSPLLTVKDGGEDHYQWREAEDREFGEAVRSERMKFSSDCCEECPDEHLSRCERCARVARYGAAVQQSSVDAWYHHGKNEHYY